jgi:hypothetical protein
MPSQQIKIVQDDAGNVTGLELVVGDDGGNERSVVSEINGDATIDIEGRAPDGTTRSGTIDPSGNGSDSLGV